MTTMPSQNDRPPIAPGNLAGAALENGRYEIDVRLGSGSMGHVYRAFDRRLETDVVIKVPTLARLEDPEFLNRFMQECRFLVRLSHPNIVKIIDVGREGNLPYVVMQYLAGGSLTERLGGQRLKLKPMTPVEVAAWLPQVAKALDFMHGQNFIHRDVKPANILFDEHNNAYLSDFGLSKLQVEDGGMTAAGAVVGSPNYMAPEVVLAKDCDGRADQYSLAVTVHEVLAGSVPFEGGAPTATMVMHTNTRPPALCDVNGKLSVDLSRVVLRGLSKKKESRYPTCSDFADDFLAAIGFGSSSSLHRTDFEQPSPSTSGRSSGSRSAVNRSGVNRAQANRESSRRSAVRPAGRSASSSRRSAVCSTPPRKNSASGSHAASSQFEESSNSYTGVRYAVTKISRGGGGRVPCPSCGKNIKLKFKHAGRRGICNNCGSRLLISDDLTTLKLLRPVKPGMALHPQTQMVTLPNHSSQDDLVLGTSLFGLKLGMRLAIGLGAALIVFLIGLTIYMTAKAVEKQQEQQEATQRYKSTE